MTLHRVLLVLDFKYNFLSIIKLLQTKKLIAYFDVNHWSFQDRSTKMVVDEGNGLHGLYKLQVQPPPSSHSSVSSSISNKTTNIPCISSFNSSQVVENTHTIHTRLGHVSVSKLKHINVYKHLNFIKFLCHTYQLSKFHRLPFSEGTSTSTHPFDILYIDLWGPYKTLSLDGVSFVLTIFDEFTRCTWTHLLCPKTQVPLTLINFTHYVQNQFQTLPKIFRSDNSNEFVNSTCSSFFSKHGIIHQKSMSYTPQQNHIVERKHRHLLHTTRSLLIHANLPSKFWGECILTATLLINKLPTTNLNWKSPIKFMIFHTSRPLDV